MTQFEILQERVSAAVAALPYALSEEQNARLASEMEAIRDYHRAEMILCTDAVNQEAIASGSHIELYSKEGYCVSFVFWLLGISDFNPYGHTELITERYCLDTFRKKSSIKIFMRDTQVGRDAVHKLYGSRYQYKLDFMVIDADATETGMSFKIGLTADKGIGRIYRLEDMIRKEVCPDFKVDQIPLDDVATFDAISNFDLEGVINSVSIELLSAIRQVQPHSFSDLVEAFGAAKNAPSRFYEYVRNRKAGIKESTGIASVDDILSHTYGVILYCRQAREISDRLKCLGKNELGTVLGIGVDDLYPAKCSVYSEVIDIYRRTYMKVHFPEIFERVLLADLIA